MKQWLTSLRRYEQLLGCSDVDLTNTSSLYARYTISVLCNAIIQNSIQFCNSDESGVRPLCADTCVCASNTYSSFTDSLISLTGSASDQWTGNFIQPWTLRYHVRQCVRTDQSRLHQLCITRGLAEHWMYFWRREWAARLRLSIKPSRSLLILCIKFSELHRLLLYRRRRWGAVYWRWITYHNSGSSTFSQRYRHPDRGSNSSSGRR